MATHHPFHRRTIDEACQVCGASPQVGCVDLRRTTVAVPTKNLHLYRPEVAR